MTNLRMHKHYLMFSVVQVLLSIMILVQQLTQNKILYIIKSKGEHGNRSRNNIDISNDDRYLYQNNCRKRSNSIHVDQQSTFLKIIGISLISSIHFDIDFNQPLLLI